MAGTKRVPCTGADGGRSVRALNSVMRVTSSAGPAPLGCERCRPGRRRATVPGGARYRLAAQSWRDHGRWRVREFLDYQASYYRAARHGKPYSQVPGRDLAGTWPDNIGAGEN